MNTIMQCPNIRQSLKILKLSWRSIATVAENSTSTKNNVPIITSDPFDSRVSEVIDVRTPTEFAIDHIPGAINLPVLKNKERVEVGTLYNSSPFEARKLGAAHVAKSIGAHIDNHFQSKPVDYTPLIYCWRGGQRSHSMALVLSQIGFSTFLLEGGYKFYRRTVNKNLVHLPQKFTFKVITGLTGSGKTLILENLQSHGAQILDLEGLAKHKGSVLGLWHGETQPKQKYWESLLNLRLNKFDENKPVWIESESIRIGTVSVPMELFKCMCGAERYKIHLPLEERVKYIINTYPNWIENKDSLKEVLNRLVKVCGRQKVEEWNRMIDDSQWETFVSSILVEHYDPTYSRSQKKNNLAEVAMNDVHIPDLSPATLSDLCANLVQSTSSR